MSPPAEPFHCEIDWNLDLGDGEKIILNDFLVNSDLEEGSEVPQEPELESGQTAGGKEISAKKAGQIGGPSRRAGRKKPRGMPKRPLSAYNLFFQSERPRIFDEMGKKIGFEELGRLIGYRWRTLSVSERKNYEILAEEDITRYRKELQVYEDLRRKRWSATDCTEQLKPSPTLGQRVASPSSESVSQVLPNPNQARGVYAPSFHRPPSPQPSDSTVLHGHAALPREIPIPLPGPSHQNYQPIDPQPNQHFPRDAAYAGSSIPGVPTVPGSSVPGMTVPPGAEIMLHDDRGIERRYVVQYNCYRMTRAEADAYIQRLSAGPSPFYNREGNYYI